MVVIVARVQPRSSMTRLTPVIALSSVDATTSAFAILASGTVPSRVVIA